MLNRVTGHRTVESPLAESLIFCLLLQEAQRQTATKGQGKGLIYSVRQTNKLLLTMSVAWRAVVGL